MVAALVFLSSSWSLRAETVTFADAALEAAVREALEIPVGPVTTADMLELEVLSAPEAGIASLSGLEHAVNLLALDLFGNELAEWPTEFSVLTKLEELDLGANLLGVIPASIAELTALVELLLDANMITEVSPAIGQLQGLLYVNLAENLLEEVPAGLNDLPSIQILDLSLNFISSLQGTENLAATVEDLFLRWNDLVAIPSYYFTSPTLLWLDLAFNLLNDLPTIEAAAGGVVPLEDLDISRNFLTEFPPGLERLESLIWLRADGNLLRSPLPSELLSLPLLAMLNVAENRLDVRPGSDDRILIEALEAEGVVVFYDLQDFEPPNGSGFEDWAEANEIPADRRGFLDTNGPFALPNLAAYAYGVNPFTVAADDLPRLVLLPDGSPTLVHLLNPAAGEVEVIYEGSENLHTWAPLDVLEVIPLGFVGESFRLQVVFEPGNPFFVQVRVLLPAN